MFALVLQGSCTLLYNYNLLPTKLDTCTAIWLLCYFVLLDGYAPFQSMSVRESFLTISEGAAAAPGPGHYSPAINFDGAKGPLQNKVC